MRMYVWIWIRPCAAVVVVVPLLPMQLPPPPLWAFYTLNSSWRIFSVAKETNTSRRQFQWRAAGEYCAFWKLNVYRENERERHTKIVVCGEHLIHTFMVRFSFRCVVYTVQFVYSIDVIFLNNKLLLLLLSALHEDQHTHRLQTHVYYIWYIRNTLT